MDFYFDSAFAKFDKSAPAGKKEIGKIILPAIKRLQNKIEQSHWVQKLSEKLDVSHEAVLEELQSTKIENQPIAETVKKDSLPVGRKKLIEDKIIALAMKNPENLALIEEAHHCLFCDRTKNLIECLKRKENIPEAEFNDIALQAEIDYGEDGADEIQLCLSQLKDIELRNKLTGLSGNIKSEANEQKKDELVREFSKIAKDLHQKI
jgi:DNA primase